MNHVLACLLEQHDLKLLPIAVGLALLATTTSFLMAMRARAADGLRQRAAWIVGSGLEAGAGIWATHFVAMLAYRSGLPISFDPGLTALSAATAMAMCALGWALAMHGLGGVIGGMVRGIGICVMHYLGMAAVQIPAVAVWNVTMVAVSVLIGVSLAGLSGWFAMRAPMRRIHAILAVLLYCLAIVGMHFTGMAAVRFLPQPEHAAGVHVLHPTELAMITAACAGLILALGLTLAMVDRYLAMRAQGEAARMRAHICELEATQVRLRKTSEALLKALDTADQANHAKSAFLASMSHELRTPLNAIIGFSDMMTQQVMGPLTGRYLEYAGDIRASGQHLLALINDLLDLSRLDADKLELQEQAFDPAQLVMESLRLVTGQAAKARVGLDNHVSEDLPLLMADPRRIKQIVLNLLSNAVKFTPPGGRVMICAQTGEQGLTIAVRDTGIGIAAAAIPRVMERFGQVDSWLSRKHEGTGLGLPLSRALAQVHGGDLTLESLEKVGTTVTLTLPVARLRPRAEAAA